MEQGWTADIWRLADGDRQPLIMQTFDLAADGLRARNEPRQAQADTGVDVEAANPECCMRGVRRSIELCAGSIRLVCPHGGLTVSTTDKLQVQEAFL